MLVGARLGLQRAASPGASARRCAAAGLREAIAVAAPPPRARSPWPASRWRDVRAARHRAAAAVPPARAADGARRADRRAVRPAAADPRADRRSSGRATWWPSRARAAVSSRELHEEVAARTGYGRAGRRRDHARDARHPGGADPGARGDRARAPPARRAGEADGPRRHTGQPFGGEEFAARVAERAAVPARDAVRECRRRRRRARRRAAGRRARVRAGRAAR